MAFRILILAANPRDTNPLKLGEEVKKIQTALKVSRNRDDFEVIQQWEVQVAELQPVLHEYSPQIVHFSGHGDERDGLILVDEQGKARPVSTEALAELFSLFKDTIKCVVLNACYSEVQANAIHESIPIVIGMNQSMADKAAIIFAEGFYRALGENRSIADAFKLGCNALGLEDNPNDSTPVMMVREDGIVDSISQPVLTLTTSLGPNPYKSLQAFQETDADRFFGRETEIQILWKKLRSLYGNESSQRLLPIYGPSGSGKSSLARAGLIPELARHPLSGYDQARVAVLVPGNRPLEALATVLARIATNDPTPAEKSQEFERVLRRTSDSGNYDGLRRIANTLPDITISPLIVLVDQFEEVYTLCETQDERDAFIANLLCAASDRARCVSVIVTLRSDFLGQIQQDSQLNQLFSSQGFLVPAMSEENLRDAIAKPAKQAGHPLDEATIQLLIEQTEGREGALPLLQFALTRIWEGLEKGVAPATTLEQIGGVGGALAGEAQRVYDELTDKQQEIARRLFLGLVQLGEGTRDTRRRVELALLRAQQDDEADFRTVLNRFSVPEVRLITLAAVSEGTDTAEVTHEALFEHWQQLDVWLNQSRNDIRFQRRLQDAARHWNNQDRPEGSLWRPPDLDLLKSFHERASNEMTPLEVEFFNASVEAIERSEREENVSDNARLLD